MRNGGRVVRRFAIASALLMAGAGVASAQAVPAAHWDTLQKYCFGCHNTDDWAGGLAFEALSHNDLPADAKSWEATIRKMRGRLMPPPGKDRPSEAEAQGLINWLETSLDAAAGQHVAPGRVGLHRLNRREYANAVRDLLDVDVDAATLLPRDDERDGFDNIAASLQVSPSFMDQYVAAAQIVATLALGNRTALAVGTNYFAGSSGPQRRHRDGLPFGTRGGFVVEHFFPADGEYALTVSDLARGLAASGVEHENTLVALLDGKEFFRTTIGGEQDNKTIDQKQDPAVDAVNKRLKDVRFHATAGQRKVTVTFLERTLAETDSRLHSIDPLGGQDRILRVNSFEIRGPFKIDGVSMSPSRARVFSCYPAADANAMAQRACAQQIIASLAARAFRRPLTVADTDSLLKLYDSAAQGSGFEAGMKRAVTGVLASPWFLFRTDLSNAAAAKGVNLVDDLALASRLSFFLWSSLPDDELLGLAQRGTLHETAVLSQQIQRMLADQRAGSLVTNFAFQWLNLGRLDEIDADPRLFPYAAGSSDPRPDFREELRLFIGSILQRDRSVLDLLTADHTFLNERLAVHYGIHDVKGAQFREVKLDQTARYGLLGKGAVLMLTSYPNRTAPVLRGQWVLERILGTPPAPPPPMVESLKEDHGPKPKTVRELMQMHRRNPNCNSCHGVMDPLGFALENFDAVGQYRTMDREAREAIDASGVLPDGTQVHDVNDLRAALLKNPGQFAQTFTEKLMTYGLGRSVEYGDMPAVRAIVRRAAADNYRFSSIVMGIVTSDAFSKTDAGGTGNAPRLLTTQTDSQEDR
jgi:mono/diheme cytochrome c family protein